MVLGSAMGIHGTSLLSATPINAGPEAVNLDRFLQQLYTSPSPTTGIRTSRQLMLRWLGALIAATPIGRPIDRWRDPDLSSRLAAGATKRLNSLLQRLCASSEERRPGHSWRNLAAGDATLQRAMEKVALGCAFQHFELEISKFFNK